MGPLGSITIDFGIISALMLVSTVIRNKVIFFQNLYLPVALIAGILGIILGKHGLDVLPFSDFASSYAGYLFNFLFATLFIGREVKEKLSFKEGMRKSGDTACLNIAAFTGLYGVAALCGTTFLILLFPHLNEGFGVLAATGFAGGHGSAAAVGGAFVARGWAEGATVAQTFATIGLMVGIFCGVGLIKYATKRGYTKIITEVNALPKDMRTGLIHEDNRKSLGSATTSSMSIDSLAWHMVLVFFSSGMGLIFNNFFLKKVLPQIFFPDYVFSLLFGVVSYFVLEKIGYGSYVDKRTINRIGATITDYLVAFGVAMINIQVVIDYIVPLCIMSSIMIAMNISYIFFVSRKLYNNYWFERSIYTFGMCTGVASIGLLLLRIVDPEYKTGALGDIGVGLVGLSPIETFIVAMTPVFFMQGHGFVWGLFLTAISLSLLLICRFTFTQKTS